MARRLSDQCSIGTRKYIRITVNKLQKLVSLSSKSFQRSRTGYSVFCCFAGTYSRCCCCGSVMLGVLYKGGGGCCVDIRNFGIIFIRKDLLVKYSLGTCYLSKACWPSVPRYLIGGLGVYRNTSSTSRRGASILQTRTRTYLSYRGY